MSSWENWVRLLHFPSLSCCQVLTLESIQLALEVSLLSSHRWGADLGWRGGEACFGPFSWQAFLHCVKSRFTVHSLNSRTYLPKVVIPANWGFQNSHLYMWYIDSLGIMWESFQTGGRHCKWIFGVKIIYSCSVSFVPCDRGFHVGFNSLCAFASVNHLHFHVWYMEYPSCLETIVSTNSLYVGEEWVGVL